MPIQVSNLKDGESLCYSLALVCGEVTPASQCHGSLLAYNSADQCTQVWPLHLGTFKLVLQLYPGQNTLVLQTALDTLEFSLHYSMPRLPRFVRPLYIVCQDDPGEFQAPEDVDCSPESAVQRISLGTRLLQTFTAEKLEEHGLGRKSFALECEVDPSQPACHVYRTKLTLRKAYSMNGGELWMYFAKELMSCEQFTNKDSCKWFAFMSFTRYSPPAGSLPRSHSEVLHFTKGHAALGGGGLALFGTGTLHTWAPSLEELLPHLMDTRKIDREKFMDDSAYRECHWANFSTGLGASLHELGHTFDLAHTPTGIMARGFDDLYRVFMAQPPGGAGSGGGFGGSGVDLSRTASPVPYSPRESPVHTKRKRVNSTSESSESGSMSPILQTNHNTLPRTRSRTGSGCSTNQTSCNKDTFQVEAEFQKLTVQTSHSFTTKNYDGSESKKMVTKYRDGMETVAEITKQPGGEMVVKEVIKNLNSGKSRTVLSMTSVKSQVDVKSGSTTGTQELDHSQQGKTTAGSTQEGEKPTLSQIPTLSHITTVSNGIPAPAKSVTTDEITTQNETESSDSDGNSGNNMTTSSHSPTKHLTTMQNNNASHITTKIPQSPRKYEGVHQFRPRRKDGGAHWYRSSAVILAHHRWFNNTAVGSVCKPPEMHGCELVCPAGLCVVELRSLPEGVVLHHWEFESCPLPLTTHYSLHYNTVRQFVSSAVGHFTILAMDRQGQLLKRKMTLHDLCV